MLKQEKIFNLPRIETKRCILRKFTKNDIDDLYEYASDSEVTQFLSWDTYKSIDMAVDYIENVLLKYSKNEIAPWGIEWRENSKLIGSIDFVQYDEKNFSAEIGYVLNKKYWNKGIMTEALKEIIAADKLPPEIYIKAEIMLSDYTEDNPEQSYNYLKTALDNAESCDDEILLAELYYKFAVSCDEIGETKQAVLFYKNCVEINRKGNQFISSAYSNLAAIYDEAGVKESAAKFYELSLQIDEENENLNGIYLSAMKLAGFNRK